MSSVILIQARREEKREMMEEGTRGEETRSVQSRDASRRTGDQNESETKGETATLIHDDDEKVKVHGDHKQEDKRKECKRLPHQQVPQPEDLPTAALDQM